MKSNRVREVFLSPLVLFVAAAISASPSAVLIVSCI
jgi:hypothetical protein